MLHKYNGGYKWLQNTTRCLHMADLSNSISRHVKTMSPRVCLCVCMCVTFDATFSKTYRQAGGRRQQPIQPMGWRLQPAAHVQLEAVPALPDQAVERRDVSGQA